MVRPKFMGAILIALAILVCVGGWVTAGVSIPLLCVSIVLFFREHEAIKFISLKRHYAPLIFSLIGLVVFLAFGKIYSICWFVSGGLSVFLNRMAQMVVAAAGVILSFLS